MEVVGRHYQSGEPVRITIDTGRIAGVEPVGSQTDIASLPYVAPGLFDIQINGHRGVSFCQPGLTPEDVIHVLEALFRFGITRVCPTLITDSFDTLVTGFAAIRTACEREEWVRQMVAGCHLEGPYISPEDGPRGAHPREHVRPADWDEFSRLQQISGQRICLLTLAPEVDGALPLIRNAVASGVTVAIGHTAADGAQIEAAVEAGARLSTHLGNGSHPRLRRHPNYIWEQLAEDRLMASIITDGHHLPACVVRSVIGVKTTARTIIISDAASLAGCEPGTYPFAGADVEIMANGRIVVAGHEDLLAGSGLYTDSCVAKAVPLGHVSLREAVDMAGRNPARLLGVEEIRLAPGSRADLILFHHAPGDGRLQIVTTLAAGALRFGSLP